MKISSLWGCIKSFLEVQDKSVNLSALRKQTDTGSVRSQKDQRVHEFVFNLTINDSFYPHV